jgi:hypothetical protein
MKTVAAPMKTAGGAASLHHFYQSGLIKTQNVLACIFISPD